MATQAQVKTGASNVTKTFCACGHDKFLHMMEMADRMCSQCSCWQFSTETQSPKQIQTQRQKEIDARWEQLEREEKGRTKKSKSIDVKRVVKS